MTASRKYKFSWDLVYPETDDDFRPSLGKKTDLAVYRLLQFTLRDELEERFGVELTDDLFRAAGRKAGLGFFERYCREARDVADLANIIQEKFRELSIGIVRFERVDLEKMEIQLTVDEDLDCSGLPDTNEQVCVYDEGFIQGILEGYTGKTFSVREIDCWCTGERTCRFLAKAAGEEETATAGGKAVG